MGERDLEKFDRIYRHRDEILREWADAIKKISAADIFVYVDNYFEGFAPETANKLQRLLDLPVTTAAEHEDQPSLF
jgi:uncharacterized protein YecE (DUF72 family)